MTYNLTHIRNRVINDKLDDSSFDTDVVDNFINDTQRYVFNTYELPFMEAHENITCSAGATTITLPVKCQSIQAMSITSPDGVQSDIMDKYIDFRTFVKLFPTPLNNTASIIGLWTLHAGELILSAPLDVAYTLQIFYIKKPTTLSDDSDVPEVPEEFEEVLLLGAFKRIQERNEDFDLAAITNGQLLDGLTLMASKTGFRTSDGPIIMKQPNRRR